MAYRILRAFSAFYRGYAKGVSDVKREKAAVLEELLNPKVGRFVVRVVPNARWPCFCVGCCVPDPTRVASVEFGREVKSRSLMAWIFGSWVTVTESTRSSVPLCADCYKKMAYLFLGSRRP
jgi:hypothetical protein